MADNDNTKLLKFTLAIYALLVFVYGFGYMLIPDMFITMAGGKSFYVGWLRWSGGVLIALGIGAVQTYRNPRHQGIFITVLTLGCLLASLCLFWNVYRPEEGAHLWFPATPAITLLIMALLFRLGSAKAKSILSQE